MQHRGGRVCAVHDTRVDPCGADGCHRVLEASRLDGEVPVGDAVGRGKVRERAVDLDAEQFVGHAHELGCTVRRDADAIHARVDGKVIAGLRTLGKGLLGEPAQKLEVIDGRHDAALDEGAHRGNRGLGQHDDGLGDAALTQAHAFGDRGDGEHVDTHAAQRLGDAHGTVAIGVGLHDRAEARGRLRERLPCTGVLLDGLQVNLDPSPTVLRKQALI